MTTEEWRDVVGFESRYEVSSLGRVRSKSYLKTGKNTSGPFTFWTKPRLLRPTYNEDSYLQVDLRFEGSRSTGRVHRLVATAFIANPDNKSDVNHKNSVRDDNQVENLEWATSQENTKHGFKDGFRSHVGVLHPRAKLSEDQVLLVRDLAAEGYNGTQVASLSGVKRASVYAILQGKQWTHIR